jgi:hypothetical protein
VWPFRRKEQAPAPSGPQPRPAPMIRRDWASLPAIQRLIGNHPLTAPSDRFSDDLATHHDPSVSRDQMGHQVSAEAPPGLVLALATPTTRSDGPAMIPRPRAQRRVESAAAALGEWDGDGAALDEARPSPIPAGVQRAPSRQLPIVDALPPAPALTALAPDTEPAPVLSTPRRGFMSAGEPAVRRLDDSATTTTPPARLTLGQARRMGLGAPISKVPERAVQRSAVEATVPPGTPSPSPSPSPLPSFGSDTMSPSKAAPVESSTPPLSASRTLDVRRAELSLAPTPAAAAFGSEPLPTHSDAPPRRSSAVSPAVSNAEKPSSARPSTPPLAVQASTDTARSSPDLTAQPAPTMRETPLGLSVAPVSGSREAPLDFGIGGARRMPIRSQALAGAPTEAATAAAAPTVALAADGAAAPAVLPTALAFAPLVGARPISTVQRSAEIAATAGEHRSAAAVIDHTPDRDLEFAVDDEPAPEEPGSVAKDPGESPSMPFIQRLAGEPAGDRPAAALTFPPRPRNVPTGWTGQRPTDGEASGGSNFPLAPTPVVIQRIASDESWGPPGWATATAGPALQREPAHAPTPGETPGAVSARPFVAASPNGSALPAAADRPSAEADMDALAGRLYDRIRSRLKAELLVDRERAGFLTDLR